MNWQKLFSLILFFAFVKTSAQQFTPIGGVVNIYAPVDSIDVCTNSLYIPNGLAKNYKIGDTVLLIQMKGAEVNNTLSASFGDVIDFKNAGNYEINYITAVSNNTLSLKNFLSINYDFLHGVVQIIKVPFYKNARVTATLSAQIWDGTTGGVCAVIIDDTLQLNANIDVSGKGYTGGDGKNKNQLGVSCDFDRYYCNGDTITAAYKGETYATVSYEKTGGKAKLASGGGSGEMHNSGGGGGGNGGAGGNGGRQFEVCNYTLNNFGVGGLKVPYNNSFGKVFMGSGGGGGHANNFIFNANGASGGGIVLLIAKYIDGKNNSIIANGNDAINCIPDVADTNKCREGQGGGGGGGSILLHCPNFISSLNAIARGGKGADITEPGSQRHGPGGGGGGGIVWTSNATLSANISSDLSPGLNGVNIANNNDPWDAEPGQAGPKLYSLVVPFSSIPFVKNIDTVTISKTFSGCEDVQFNGLATTLFSNIASWLWDFGDGTSSTLQNPFHTYTSGGNFNAKVIASDVNNCKDSAVAIVPINFKLIDAGNDTTICKNTAFMLHGIGGNTFDWQPSLNLNNANTAAPSGILSTPTKFFLTSDFGGGCVKNDSVLVSIFPDPSFAINKNISICDKQQVQLQASGADVYVWSPAAGLSDVNVSNPIASPTQTTKYAVHVTRNLCNDTTTLSTTVFVLPLPVIKSSKSNDLDCTLGYTQLNAIGGLQYTWIPASGLSNTNISNPIASPTASTKYIVSGKDQNGCVNTDSVLVNVSINGNAVLNMPNAFTPNGDGLNDCFGIKYLAVPENIDFSIYNRFGQRIFHTENVYACWDGTFNGIKQAAGTYVYYIKSKTICGDVFTKGTIVLIR